jgi:hypothetical protein
MFKEYIGDGVYVNLDISGALVLTTEDGINVLNTIYLDDGVWRRLLVWKEDMENVIKVEKGTGNGNE